MKTNHFMALGLRKAAAALSAAAALALLTSCALPKKPEPQPEPPARAQKKPAPEPKKPSKPGTLYQWNGDGAEISHIEVSIDEQKARFYSGGEQVGWTVVASGIRKYPTPAGDFAVIEKVEDKRSNLYGKIYNSGGKLVKRNAKRGRDAIPAGGRFQGAKMPFFIRLTNDGIGLHGGPIPRPGRRASHGCIRMPYQFAPVLFRHVDVGTQVSIIGDAPSYASYLTRQRRSAPKPASARVAKAKTATDPTAQAQPPAPQPQTDATAPAMAGVAPSPPAASPAPAPDTQAGTSASTMAGARGPMPHAAPAAPVSLGAALPPSPPETSPAMQAEAATKATIQTQPQASMSSPGAQTGASSTTMPGTSGPIPNAARPVTAPSPTSLPQSPLGTSSSRPASTTTAAPNS